MAEKVALKEIQENKDIMILPADKRRVTVILDKAEYEQKMETMLSDRHTYEVPVQEVQGKTCRHTAEITGGKEDL